ncbi:MAG: hypothetical protein EGR20_10545 [Alistipes onderdonkii]|nr:hypothetical protein [Alistipes onderdonkii]
MIQSLIELKNNLAAQGRYTDAVDDVLCKNTQSSLPPRSSCAHSPDATKRQPTPTSRSKSRTTTRRPKETTPTPIPSPTGSTRCCCARPRIRTAPTSTANWTISLRCA